MSFRDVDGLRAVAALVDSTGLFAAVLVGRNPPQLADLAAVYPRAWLKPVAWKEVSDADPEARLRTVSYRLEITDRREDGTDSAEMLDRLASAVQDAVEGQDLGGCLPALTAIAEARYPENDRLPEQSIWLNGQFAYLVSGWSGHPTDPEV